MNLNLKELLKEQKRGDIRYIYPGEDIDTIAKMIAALANMRGGTLLFGIEDDGCDLHFKGYAFERPEKKKLLEKLEGFEDFKIKELYENNKTILQIDVDMNSDGVNYGGIFPVFYSDYHNMMKEAEIVEVFISYNHKTSKIADIVEENLNKKYRYKVKINRDNQLVYRDDIEKYMDTIKENDIIVSLITDNYLKSEACMYEITELMRDTRYSEKLAFIIINEADLKYTPNEAEIIPNIYGEKRYEYIEYWVNEKRKYSDRLKNLSDSYTSTVELNATIRRIGRICDEIGSFLDFLNRSMGQNFTTMHNNDFLEIKRMIDEKINEVNS
ncbi:TIR domain-containing protein [Enterococcus faecalis]|uniref:TIR domain-containing protein n=1 Tax=Enterococcus faecalis TaxID=1351 RepID=UPI0021C9FFD6|nr:TIR domain-containing protein [Enterococcus faecalis]MCU2220013.1 TIR domain-containing protein [Enterococcus faecalis]